MKSSTKSTDLPSFHYQKDSFIENNKSKII
jgi:hypothetical protein